MIVMTCQPAGTTMVAEYRFDINAMTGPKAIQEP